MISAKEASRRTIATRDIKEKVTAKLLSKSVEQWGSSILDEIQERIDGEIDDGYYTCSLRLKVSSLGIDEHKAFNSIKICSYRLNQLVDFFKEKVYLVELNAVKSFGNEWILTLSWEKPRE